MLKNKILTRAAIRRLKQMLCKKTLGEPPPPPIEYIIVLNESEKNSLLEILKRIPDPDNLGNREFELNEQQCRFLIEIKEGLLAARHDIR